MPTDEEALYAQEMRESTQRYWDELRKTVAGHQDGMRLDCAAARERTKALLELSARVRQTARAVRAISVALRRNLTRREIAMES